jgi:NAD(P)-dependent dehydrogenase (short-subunit alcohol dehydrogenase family)
VTGRVTGKVALVSGAARGQGEAHGRLLAEHGASVIFGDVLDVEGAAVAEDVEQSGGAARYVHLDVTQARDWERAVALAESEFGRLDILVSNAGVLDDMTGAVDTSESEWARVIAVNQTGVFLGMKYAIPALQRAGGGAIVNVSSVYGIGGVSGYFAYQASKGAVVMMTKSAALTYGKDGIRVNTICPGAIRTAMLEAEGEENIREFVAGLALTRSADPREVSQGVLYLCSDESAYVTGTELVIDGGYLARG